MQGVRLAAVVPGTGLCLICASPFYGGEALHPVGTLARPMGKWHRERPMVGILTFIYRCKESSHRRRIDKYHVHSARAGREKDRSVAHSAEYQYQQDDV